MSTPGWFVPAFPTGAARASELSIGTVLRKRWLLLLVVPLLLSAAAVAYVVTAPRIYEARVLLAPVTEEELGGVLGSFAGQFRGLAPALGLNLGGGNTMADRAIAVMHSRSFTTEYLRKNDLLPELFPERWDAVAKAWKTREPTIDEMFERFDRDVRFISTDRKNGFTQVSLRLRNRESTVRWAALFVEQVNVRMREQAADEATRNLEYLRRELANDHPIGVQNALFDLVETQIRDKMMASVRHEYAFRVVDPPTLPDSDRFVSPRRALSVALAFVVGLLLAVTIAIFLERRRTI